jgi:DNA (cytosine-5)-methyltransferase 1
MDELGYSVAWRTLDARYFGVAQRRRRVFIVASLEPNRAEQVLFECEGVCGHLAPSKQTRQGVAGGAPDGSGIARTVRASLAKRGERGDGSDDLIVSQTPDSDGVREADGLARRVDNQQGVEAKGMRVGSFAQYVDDGTASPLRATGGDLGGGSENLAMIGYQTRADDKNGNFSINEAEVANSLSALWPSDTSHRSMTLVAPSDSIISFPSAYSRQPTKFNDVSDPLTLSAGAPAVFRKSSRAQTNEDSETWVEGDVANTLNSFDVGDVRTTHAILGGTADDDSLLPVGLDSHRYRCCGNGVVSSVAEWIGRRIVAVDVLD